MRANLSKEREGEDEKGTKLGEKEVRLKETHEDLLRCGVPTRWNDI